MWHSTKRCSSIFDLGPLTPKISPQNLGTKSPISRLLRQIKLRYLRLTGGLGDGRFNGTMQIVVGPTLVAMATKVWQIWANLQKIAYKLACTADRPEIFGPTGGGATRGPTLVAMATNFGLARRGDPDAYRLVCLPANRIPLEIIT